jgi:hypothetical protein
LQVLFTFLRSYAVSTGIDNNRATTVHLAAQMFADDGYDTDDTGELLASKCSLQPAVIACSNVRQTNQRQQQHRDPQARSASQPTPSAIVTDDWLFSISATSERNVGATGAAAR